MEKEIETVASFKNGNYSYTIKQPKQEPIKEDLEKLYITLGRIINRD